MSRHPFCGTLLLLWTNIDNTHRSQKDAVTFEAFEAAALSEKVLASQGALQWDFPGYAVSIPYSEFAQPSFQENLASFLEQASTESIKQFAAQVFKAGSTVFESRETADPSLITQMLMTLLEVNGHRVQPPVIRKRVRDEVYWSEGADKPWRRSPYWLVLRVALQRLLSVFHGGLAGRAHYKFLFCVVLRDLIEEGLGFVSPETVAFLQAKLARRLAKLEVERDHAPMSVQPVYDAALEALGELFSRTLSKANQRLAFAWDVFKKSIQRHVPTLPRRALPGHLKLSLPNSESYLRKVLSWQTHMDNEAQTSASAWLPSKFDVLSATKGPFKSFANRYFLLCKLEMEIAVPNRQVPVDPQSLCVELASTIHKYISAVDDAYQSNTEGKSVMILSLMELWMTMDSVACRLYPLLRDYSPGFPPETLDVVQLLFYDDMSRLETIQRYLKDRQTNCNLAHQSIFDDPGRGCFAERYFDESADSPKLYELRQAIEDAANRNRKGKEDQWRKLSAEFEQLQRTILQSRCTYVTKDNYRTQHDEHCQKCYLENKRDHMRIRVHEHPLPSDPVQAKVVVFELHCPRPFNAYRNATWRLLGILARPREGQRSAPRLTLTEYSELKDYMEPRAQGICLASTTKSWLRTHYHGILLPVELDDVCLPNALRLCYYDTVTGIWPGKDTFRPTFAHHCPLAIPSESPFSALRSLPEFSADSNGPTSYEVLASQVSDHGFFLSMVFQRHQ